MGLHACQYLYAGVKQVAQETDGSASIPISNGPPSSGFTRIAQKITLQAAQTAIGYVAFYGHISTNGGDLTLELYADAAGVPGAQVGSTKVTVPADFWPGSNGWVYVPLPITGLTAGGTYHLVLIAGDTNGNNGGDTTNYINVEKSNQTSGASTYASSTWTAQTYGFMFRVFDQALSGNLTMIFTDSGGQWTFFSYDGNGNITAVYEYTVAQGAGRLRVTSTPAYSSALPTVVT